MANAAPGFILSINSLRSSTTWSRPAIGGSVQLPDEALVDWHQRGLLGELLVARVLDVGCGGRNSSWFAGRFGIITFAGERMETPTDQQVTLSGDTAGGMTFTLEDLREIFSPLEAVELRAFRADGDGGGGGGVVFGADFLNAGVFTASES